MTNQLPKSLTKRLEKFGLRAEPSPNGERYKLVCVRTGLTVGFKGYIWSLDEIEWIVGIYERRETEKRGVESEHRP
jgi:hypothetical protein